MATGTASSFIVQNFADDTPKRVRLSTVENPLKPGSDQLAAIQGKIKVNPSVLEPITLPATRQNFDAAIERGQAPPNETLPI